MEYSNSAGVCFLIAPDTNGANRLYQDVKDIAAYGKNKFPVHQFSISTLDSIETAVNFLLTDYRKNKNIYLLQIDAHGGLYPDGKFKLAINNRIFNYPDLSRILFPLNLAYWNNLTLLLNSCYGAKAIMEEGRIFKNELESFAWRLIIAPNIAAKESSLMNDYSEFYKNLTTKFQQPLVDCLDNKMIARHELITFDLLHYCHITLLNFLCEQDNPSHINSNLRYAYTQVGQNSRPKNHRFFKTRQREELYKLVFRTFCLKNFIHKFDSEKYKNHIGYYEFIEEIKKAEVKFRSRYARKSEMKIDINALISRYFKDHTA